MKEFFLSPVIVMYAKYTKKWILSNRSHNGSDTLKYRLLEGIIRLLPLGRSTVIPIQFLISFLSEALSYGCSNERKEQLHARIASQLDLATIEDSLFPMLTENKNNIIITSNPEVERMRTIVSIFISQEYMNGRTDESVELSFRCEETLDRSSTSCCSFNKSTISIVANMWDEYIAHIALDVGLSPSEFLELVEVIPTSTRSAHDMLYKAIHTYLMVFLYQGQNHMTFVAKLASLLWNFP